MIYSGKKLQEIIFPLGGIGTGSIGLAGNGGLVDWEIFNRPAKGSLNEYSFFAIKAAFPDGKSVIKVLQGDQTTGLMGKYTKMLWQGYGFGPHSGRMCAFPHFKKVRFDGRFPFATLTFTDDDFPAKVTLQAFNPFIPLDAKNSSIPAAFFDIRIDSYAENVEYTVVLSLANPFPCSENRCVSHKNYTAVKLLYSGKAETDVEYGDMTVAVDQPDGICQEYWYRSGTQFSDNDKVRAFWDELTAGSFRQRHYSCPSKGDVCSVVLRCATGLRESAVIRFASGTAVLRRLEGLQLPKEALHRDEAGDYVYLSTGLTAERVDVEILYENNGFLLVAGEGLHPGSEILLGGSQLYDGRLLT